MIPPTNSIPVKRGDWDATHTYQLYVRIKSRHPFLVVNVPKGADPFKADFSKGVWSDRWAIWFSPAEIVSIEVRRVIEETTA